MAAPAVEKPALSPEASVLAPGVKVPAHAQGYLLTLKEQNAWWKVNTTLEALELVRHAWRELNGADAAPPALEPHAVAGAPGALFISQGPAPSGAQKTSPVDIAHRILEDVAANKETAALGEHLVRVLPVEDTCALEVGAIEQMAAKLLPQHLPEGTSGVTFAVRPETHSPHFKEGVTAGDLVRRVADVVPRNHTVRLVDPKKTVLLMLVADAALISVVDDWHQLHKFNVAEMRKGEAA